MKFDHKRYPVLGYRMSSPEDKRAFTKRIKALMKKRKLTIAGNILTQKYVFIMALDLGLRELEEM